MWSKADSGNPAGVGTVRRNGDANGMRSDWFVIGFTRGAKHPARAEVIMRASGHHHAHRLAAYFSADNGSAVVLSSDCFSAGGQRRGLRLEAKFGDVPDDPDALADKLIAAWTDPKLKEISTAAKHKMCDFAPEKTVTSLLTYYSEVLNGKARNGR